MDNECGCGLDCGEITGSLMETLRGCREHARSGHMLTRPPGPEPEAARGGNRGFVSAQRCSHAPFVCSFISNITLVKNKEGDTLKVMWNNVNHL